MTENMKKQASLSDHLAEEYEKQSALFELQPVIVQRFLETQGKAIAEAVANNSRQVHFSLPDQVVCTMKHLAEPVTVSIPQGLRNHSVGGFLSRLRGDEFYKLIRHQLTELEQSPDRAISVAASLLRHAAALHMVHNMLPAGRQVTYLLSDDEETIPSVPAEDPLHAASAITTAGDAIVEQGAQEAGRGDLLVPFVPYARRFYLPQWVAFNEDGSLLAKSDGEAEAHVKSMQNYMNVLFLAVSIAPYITADPEYIRKRSGMLGQLVNQARALAVHYARQMLEHIRGRAAAGTLNRGLSLSLPYFDDQELKMELENFEVIPAGRVMFVPAFVVRAVRQEEMKISQDTRLNKSTRRHLLGLLEMFEAVFETAESKVN